MPAAHDVDWDAVKSLALQIGITDAARQFNIPNAAARKRSSREGWFRNIPRSAPLPLTLQPIKPKDENGNVTTVTKGSQAVQNVLRELGEQTRVSLAKGLQKGAKHVEELDGESVMLNAKNIASITKSASDVHGWSAAGPATISFRVGLLGAASEKHVDAVEIAAEVEQIEDCESDEE